MDITRVCIAEVLPGSSRQLCVCMDYRNGESAVATAVVVIMPEVRIAHCKYCVVSQSRWFLRQPEMCGCVCHVGMSVMWECQSVFGCVLESVYRHEDAHVVFSCTLQGVYFNFTVPQVSFPGQHHFN